MWRFTDSERKLPRCLAQLSIQVPHRADLAPWLGLPYMPRVSLTASHGATESNEARPKESLEPHPNA